MATFDQIRTAINTQIVTNGTNSITADMLNDILNDMVDTIETGDDYGQDFDCILPNGGSIDVDITGDTLTLTFTGRLFIVKKPNITIETTAANGQSFVFSTNYMLLYNVTNDTFTLKGDGTSVADDELYMLQWNKYTHTYTGILARLLNSLTKADYLPTVKYKQPFDCILPNNAAIKKEVNGSTLTLTFTGRLFIVSKPDVSIMTLAADQQTFVFDGNKMLIYDIGADTFSLKNDGYVVKSDELYMLQWNKYTHTYIGILARLLDTLDIIAINGTDIDEINSRTRASGMSYTSQAFTASAWSEFLEPTGQRIGQNFVLEQYLGYSQSAACYGDLAYIIQDNYGAKHKLVDMATLKVIQDVPVTQKPYQEQHNNSATFSSVFYDVSDPMPLLYLSSIYDGKVYVMRTLLTDGVYSLTQVQVITLPAQGSTFCYYPDIFINGSYLWVNGYAQQTITDPTDNAIKWFEFALPTVDENYTAVTLAEADILDTFTTPFYAYKQDGFTTLGKAYQGYGNSGQYENYLVCYDLIGKSELDKVTMPRYTNGNRLEPEGIFEYNGDIYVYRKSSDEAIPRGLYLLKLKE